MEITLETLHDNQEALRELVSSVLTLPVSYTHLTLPTIA